MNPIIQLEGSLSKALEEGVNIFIGAGFSVLAKDGEGKHLPVGDALVNEIRSTFQSVPPNLDLAKTAMFLEKTDKEKFIKFLKRRFMVSEYDNAYAHLLNANIKGIFSTNIDNLISKIFENSYSLYLNDVTLQGANFNESRAVKYVPLHGSVYNPDRKLIFSSADISSTFSNDRDIWQYLRMAIEEYPTIFWGYSLNDSGVIQTLFSNPAREAFQKSKWIILREKNESEERYFEALGLNTIISDTSSFLNYLSQKSHSATSSSVGIKSLSINLSDFKDISIPKVGTGPVRPLSDFFLGAPPIWNDIFSNKIYKTSHYEKIIDLIDKNPKHILVLGTPVSGKTTLMMQIAANYQFKGQKLVANYLHPNRAAILSKLFHKEKLLLFFDNFRDNLEAFEILNQNPNIRVIGFEREHNYEVVLHKIDDEDFEFHDITGLRQRDIQAIYDSIPIDIKNRSLVFEKKDDSIFEFLCLNVAKQNVKDRFKEVLNQLEDQSEDLTDLFVMSCYCHYCRIPVSVDMAYAFLGDTLTHYEDILYTIEQLGKLLTDYTDAVIDKDEDYFQARSQIVAETVMKYVPASIFKRVMNRFHHNVPIYRIVNYDIFKKTAYDKDFFIRAYSDWREGKSVYEFLYNREQDYYRLQQGALYLSNKRRFSDAFNWIDLAIQKSQGKIFSIKNSHAIILFEANINGDENDPIVKQNLDKSMHILSECYDKDRRKHYHTRIFAVQAIEYYKKYNDYTSREYLEKAKERLNAELTGAPLYKYSRLRELQKDVSVLLD